MRYYTSPGLSWDALLKKTDVELELLTNIDMHLFIQRAMRGRISMVSKRYAKQDLSKPHIFIIYFGTNNLYGWAMNEPLPKWKRVIPTEEEILKKEENTKRGWILKVELEYPEVSRVLEFKQKCWMEPYISMNTELRKQAKSDF